MMQKAKVLKTLDDSTFKWIESQKSLATPGRPAKPNAVRQRFFHIRKVALKELEDLTRLAEILPEDQLSQIFTHKNLAGLFRALFKFPQAKSREDYVNPSEEVLSRIDRLLPLCYEIITLLNDNEFAARLAYNFWNVLRHEGGSLWALRAVYYRSLDQTPHKKRKMTG